MDFPLDYVVDGIENFPPQYLDRLLSELTILITNNDVQSYFRFESSEPYGDKFSIIGYLLPQSEPYRNGEFRIRIIIPKEYPFESPKLQLLTFIYHPTVKDDISNPEFCPTCCCFRHRPISNISEFIKYYVDVIDGLYDGSMRCRNNLEACRLYHEDNPGYQAMAAEMVMIHAYPR